MTTSSPVVVKSDRLVLVEGKDELNLLQAMIDRWAIGGLQVIDVGGKHGFPVRLDAALTSAQGQNIELSCISILRDADENPEGAWESVAGALRSQSLPVPDSPGTFNRGTPSVGVLILPGDGSVGAVEELCWRSVADSPAGLCIDDYVDCLRVAGALASTIEGKTRAHAYLAAQSDPVARVGEGAIKGYWPLDHSAFASLRDFIETTSRV